MKKTIFLVGFIFLAKTSFSAAAPSQKALNLLNATFSQLENSSRKLSKQAQNSCSSLDEIKEEYFQLSAAWQRLWVFHVYPTTDENFKFKMQFFPDKKGRIRKELNKMLNKNQSWTVEDIANSRRYATGLPSIEFLLFDPSMEGRKNTQSYCSLLSALIRFIHLNLISPTKEKSLLWSQKDRSTKEAQELSHQFYNSMVIALENIKKLKLMRPALFKKNVVKPKRFESWRSQKSMDNILNNLEVVQSIFQEMYQPELQKIQREDLILQAQDQFQKMTSYYLSVSTSLYNIDPQSEDFERLREGTRHMIKLIGLLKRDIAEALKIPIDFNGTDGD